MMDACMFQRVLIKTVRGEEPANVLMDISALLLTSLTPSWKQVFFDVWKKLADISREHVRGIECLTLRKDQHAGILELPRARQSDAMQAPLVPDPQHYKRLSHPSLYLEGISLC